MRKSSFTFVSIALLLISCAAGIATDSQDLGYNIETPDERVILPDTLREVSGLCRIDESTFACVQDENGILFIYDFKKKEISQQYTFIGNGDYEGVALVRNTMFVLRSDGVLFEIENYTSDERKITEHQTGIPAMNNEGLCYDEANNQLLIAAKGKIGKGSELKDKRVIYGYNLTTNTLNEQPVFDFNLNDIKKFAKEHNVELAKKKKQNHGEEVEEDVLKFMTSEIAIHPKTKKLYLLSAAEHLIFVFDKNGEIEFMQNLDETIFNKAEGITFLENGDMLITNEGQDKQPTLLKFSYQK